MIASALTHVAEQLNRHLRRTLGGPDEDPVVVTNLIELDGSQSSKVSNRLVLFLVNVKKETAARQVPRMSNGTAFVESFPAIFFNLRVVLAAHPGDGNYVEALKSLSRAIAFFQSNPVIDRHIAPDLDWRIEKLVLDIENLGIHDLSNVWGMVSGRYLPSIVYRIRMGVAFDAEEVHGVTPALSQPQPTVGGEGS